MFNKYARVIAIFCFHPMFSKVGAAVVYCGYLTTRLVNLGMLVRSLQGSLVCRMRLYTATPSHNDLSCWWDVKHRCNLDNMTQMKRHIINVAFNQGLPICQDKNNLKSERNTILI